MIDWQIKHEKLGEVTVTEAREHEQLLSSINYLSDEGFILIEQGMDGELRIYPTS